MRFFLKTLVLVALAISIRFFVSSESQPVDFPEQHDALRGTWILTDVPGADPSFFLRNTFSNGKYTIETSIPNTDRGEYRVTTIHADGTFEIELTSSRYGFIVNMDIEPLEDLDRIKLDHQTFMRQEVGD
ncbi:MAG: hypothetical protein AAB413_04495 [Patescibacteria group bacterium]